MTVVRAENISCVRHSKTLLEATSLAVNAGEVLGVIGPNGSGKSTLVKLLTHHWHLSDGEVLLDGRPLQHWQRRTLARHLACLPQTQMLAFPFTVEAVVALGRLPFASGSAVNREVVRKAMAQLDITHLADRRYTELSGGEKQRTHLARVLAQVWPGAAEPRLLVLDEPFSALDLGHKKLLLDTLKRLSGEGLAIVLVEHDLNLALAAAGRILALKAGRVVSQGKTAKVATAEQLRQLFDAEIEVVENPNRPGTRLCSI